MPSMIIHDSRLKGKTPTRYNYVLQISKITPLHHIIGRVEHYGRMRKLSPLHILCHGYEGDEGIEDPVNQESVPDPHGGYGLMLGRDSLDLSNVTQTSAWKGLVGEIVVFACAPADTAAKNVGTVNDGRRFMGELALWTHARVIAARDTQYYDPSGVIDFGVWEGPVYEFSPADPGGKQILNPASYKLRA